MRSTFSDWAIEHGFDSRLVDCPRAHKLKDGVEAAYNRTNRVTERNPLMQAWGEYSTTGIHPGCLMATPRLALAPTL
jgi:integrase